MRLILIIQLTLIYICKSQEADIMKPTVNIISDLQKLQTLVEGLLTDLNATKSELVKQKALVQNLQQQITESPKVAFTASMTSEEDLHRGPFTSEKKLIFDKVLTNIGDAYNPKTGVFIAPVKGIYYFRYSGYAFTLHNMGLSIFKGNTRFVSSYEHTSGEKNDNVSNGAVMQLSAGEEVHMRLWIQSWIFVDYRYNYSTFTGYLLYPI
ncbi:cerebellin 11 [Electrophorus electricus]|uniref:cerebellin 11 n=1 Tax=Electrophorus electricus TaxID=8005 RepID=UPI0015D04597|nr:cerebellin 11 [Electrophorus electricus]